VRRRFEETKEQQNIIVEPEQKSAINQKLRYNEKLYLNRKNASAAFKSITREKRNHVPDGKGLKWEQVPPMGHYTAKYDYVHKSEAIPKMRQETYIEIVKELI
jgi:hypothetical protein